MYKWYEKGFRNILFGFNCFLFRSLDFIVLNVVFKLRLYSGFWNFGLDCSEEVVVI